MPSIQEQIQQTITEHRVVLYMKGTPDFPMCGFSGKVVQILRQSSADFNSVNVLENEEIRQGIKAFSNWPTIPQLYINGEFVGGCDIVVEMFEKGALQNMLQPQPAEEA